MLTRVWRNSKTKTKRNNIMNIDEMTERFLAGEDISELKLEGEE